MFVPRRLLPARLLRVRLLLLRRHRARRSLRAAHGARSARTARDARINRASGYTFLEIMLVVVIIGILAATVVPSLFGHVGEARETTTRQSMSALRTTLGLYEMKAGSLPATNPGLAALVTRPPEFPERDWPAGGFLQDGVPLDAWGRPFRYARPSEHGREYDISSAGADGQFDTADDLTSWNPPGAESP